MNYEGQKIIPVEINREMKKSYIDYAMSVIVGRALPDVRDGLKPVHRRILYTMFEDNLTPERPYRKSATTVGDVLGRYHPHGDASVYDALVRLAQDFSLRYPLVDGHGNFGSVDGDPPAAYRYTEARMSKIATDLLTDIDKETIDWTMNYDERRKEPTVLPSRFPNLLANGSSGIAVGMATNIPSHNLNEIIDAAVAIIDNPELTFDDLISIVKGPDFPTGGIIMGVTGIRQAFATGRGKLKVRARAEIMEFKDGREKIVVTEIPYQVNKARLIENIADHVKNKKIEGISVLRDESDRDGMSIVIELKRDANAQVVLNQLYKYTQMQETFSVIMLALVNNQPRILSLREMLDDYIVFQREIITRRTQFDLRKAKEREHILDGLKIAIDFIDEVVAIIRASKSIPQAKEALIERFNLSEVQAAAIVAMRLGQLTGLERDKIESELAEIKVKIADYEDILAKPERVSDILKDELYAIKKKYGDERRTSIELSGDDIDIEDLIPETNCVYTLTDIGYIKRQHVDTYKTQRRGGRGITGMSTREEDFVSELVIASTHDYILFFTSKGLVYRLKGYEIPEASRTAKGTNIVNLLELEKDERITAIIPVNSFEDEYYLTMVTKKGTVKRTALSEYSNIRKSGLIAIVLDEDDDLVRVKLTSGDDTLIIGTREGKAIHFDENDARAMGRVTRGVRGIRLNEGDYVIGMSTTREGAKLLTITENGYGKRTDIGEYKVQQRGGKGLINYNISKKTGKVVGIKVVDDDDDIMLISSDGIIIRMAVADISEIGRATQGVRVMKLSNDVKVVTLARTEHEEEEDIDEDIAQTIDSEQDLSADIEEREGAQEDLESQETAEE